MHLDIAQYDSFTDTVFGGNPAAVVVLPHWLDDDTLQNIAAENNLSETAFLVDELPAGAINPPSDAPTYHLKWFTPTTEIELCGHGTLASAAHLFATAHPEDERLEFWTLSGWLSVTRDGDLYTLDFPADHPHDLIDADVPAFAEALNIDGERITEIRKGSSKHMVAVDSPVWSPRPVRTSGASLTWSNTASSSPPTPPGTTRTTTSSPGASPRVWALTRIRSPAPPTPSWAPSGWTGSTGRRCPRTRPLPGAGGWNWHCAMTGCSSPAGPPSISPAPSPSPTPTSTDTDN